MAKRQKITEEHRCIDPLFGELSLLHHSLSMAHRGGVEMKITQSKQGVTVLLVDCAMCPTHIVFYHGKKCPVCAIKEK
jgi:hypothetical protein